MLSQDNIYMHFSVYSYLNSSNSFEDEFFHASLYLSYCSC